jgi:hypothetical protein
VADVSAHDVHEALFNQSLKRAPSVNGIGFSALRLLWRWADDRMVSLVQGCIRTGYHPCTWKTAKGILLHKQAKATYTIAKAYRAISLLSCFGKVVEKVVETWIASFCETNDVFHRGQFGCRRGRGTSEALAQLVAENPESLITSFVFIHRVHPITPSCSSGPAVGVTRIASVFILSVSALFQWLRTDIRRYKPSRSGTT